MQIEQALLTFIAECRELLTDMESALLELAPGLEQPELVNAVFRAAHTVKGSAGMFGLDHVVTFTHALESVLNRVRDGLIPVSEPLIALLLRGGDHLGNLVDNVASGEMDESSAMKEQAAPLLASLREYLAPEAEASGCAARDTTSRSGRWHISLRPDESVLQNGLDPLNFIRYLSTFGEIKGISTVCDALPEPDCMDPESCYLGFEICFETAADRTTIENAFEFLRNDCRLQILPQSSSIEEYLRLIQVLPEGQERCAALLMQCGTLTSAQAAELFSRSASQESGNGEAGAQTSTDAVHAHPGPHIAQPKNAPAPESNSIRIDANKLDHLINQVGELIIAGAAVKSIAQAGHLPDLQESVSKLSSLVEDVRDSALQLRTVKIGATLNRFRRVVHDVAKEIGKEIELEIEGEETELDKTVVEKIADPLMHLVRNAVDHGIEVPDTRRACGKPQSGKVKLAAYHDSGSIVIAVSDDGAGLNRERILNKAIGHGLIQQSRNISDNDIFNVIFEPGFSTAENVTNLSGRGVGLDVVKRNITALRGSIEVDTKEGVGTSFTVRLPLTLAIIDGFLVGIDKSVFAIPLDMIDECVAFSAMPNHEYTSLRGEVLPVIGLREMFGIEGSAPWRQNIVVLKHAGKKAGLVVDTLLGEFQTVIKPIGKMFSRIRCISGSTILGNGEVALILDVPALVQQAREESESRAASAESSALAPQAVH